jgi:hypothetical protein
MTTQTNSYPNIVPPVGAETLCEWADWGNEYRFVTNDHRVEGTNIVLSPCAAQLPDGSIDTEATVASDPPHVTIYEITNGHTWERMRVDLTDARKLAQALLDAADEIDRWATT